MSEERLVLCEIVENVAVLTLNRPEKLNSFTRAMAGQLREYLDKVVPQPQVRAVLLTGAGRAFCAGQDLNEAPTEGQDGGQPDLGSIVRELYIPLVTGIRQSEKPFVCAVNGVAAGAGANLALACDIVVAASDATFVQAFSKIGLVPDCGGTFILPRLIGLGKASAITMLAEKVSADEASAMGMIYKVIEKTSLQQQAFEIATTLAKMPTRALGLTKRALNLSLGNDLSSQLDLEAMLQGEAGRTEDFKEGIAAFKEKRVPRFQGK